MTDYNKLAEILFPDITFKDDYYEELYPKRDLPEGAFVTRIAPSPTGFIHLGNLYGAIIDERLARQSGGVFYLRIEDTDNKREVSGAVETILSSLKYFGIEFDEGALPGGDRGNYGPYRQRQRKAIYQHYAKRLVKMGMAYPCFCSEDELTSMRAEQKSLKENFGYYGKYAVCRNKTTEEVADLIGKGRKYVLRFKSGGDIKNHIKVYDAIRGEIQVQENYQDFVLLKSDGIPTYHFAHAVDDHLMRTTHAVRGEEWLATLPIHAQLFDTFGWKRPVYCHTATLMKMDGVSKRKLSKRKDPELALSYYRAEGYPVSAVWEYMLTVLNSGYETWRGQNPDKAYTDYPFRLDNMSNSGALFDLVKLSDISRGIISKLSAAEVYDELIKWAEEYDRDFAAILKRDKAYTLGVLSVGRGGEKPRKDYSSWKQAKDSLSFYFDELFTIKDVYPENVSTEDRKSILSEYIKSYCHTDDKNTWFEKIRVITDRLGYAVQPKKYKNNPELYKGSIVDVSNVIRISLVGLLSSPDLWEISQALGEDCVLRRLKKAMEI